LTQLLSARKKCLFVFSGNFSTVVIVERNISRQIRFLTNIKMQIRFDCFKTFWFHSCYVTYYILPSFL
jgi:hypothetical protein